MRDYWNILKLFDRNVRYFLIAGAVHGFVFFGIYSLLLNLYLLRLGYDSAFIGLVNGLGPLMLAVFSLPAGMVSRRWGSRRVMLWSYLVLALSFGLLPLSEWLPEAYRSTWIVGTYVTAWLGGAFLIVNFAPYLMAWTGEQERNYAFAMQAASLPVAGFLGNLVGGALPNLFASLSGGSLDSPDPYRNALLVAAVIELLAVVAMKFAAEVQETTDIPATQSGSHTSAPYRIIILFALINLLAVAGEWTMRVYFNVYLDRVMATPTAVIGALLASAQLMGLTAFLAPQAAARWGRQRVVLMGLFCIPIAFVPLVLINHWLAVGMGYMILVATLSVAYPTLGVFSQSMVAPRWRTTMASAMSMSIGVGIAITSFGGGYVITAFGFQTLVVLAASVGLLGGGVVWRFLPRAPVSAVVPVPVVDAMD